MIFLLIYTYLVNSHETSCEHMKINIIIGLILWLLFAYFAGRQFGKYNTGRQTNTVVLNSTFELVNHFHVELLSKSTELLIEKHPAKGVIVYLVTFGGYYIFERGYRSTYIPPLTRLIR